MFESQEMFETGQFSQFWTTNYDCLIRIEMFLSILASV